MFSVRRLSPEKFEVQPHGFLSTPPVWGPRGRRPVQGAGGVSLCRGGFGRSIQDFWFRTFPLHSEKEGRKRRMGGGERKERFHTSYLYFWRN